MHVNISKPQPVEPTVLLAEVATVPYGLMIMGSLEHGSPNVGL